MTNNKIIKTILEYFFVIVCILCVSYPIVLAQNNGFNLTSILCLGACVAAAALMGFAWRYYSISNYLGSLPSERKVRKRVYKTLKDSGCQPIYDKKSNMMLTRYQGRIFVFEFNGTPCVKILYPKWAKIDENSYDMLAMNKAIDCAANRRNVLVQILQSNEDNCLHLCSTAVVNVYNCVPNFDGYLTANLDSLIASQSFMENAYSALAGGGRSAGGRCPVGFATSTADEQPATDVRAATDCHTDVS